MATLRAHGARLTNRTHGGQAMQQPCGCVSADPSEISHVMIHLKQKSAEPQSRTHSPMAALHWTDSDCACRGDTEERDHESSNSWSGFRRHTPGDRLADRVCDPTGGAGHSACRREHSTTGASQPGSAPRRPTDSAGTRPTGRPDCVISRRARRAGSRRGDLSHRSRRSGTMDASACRAQGRRFGKATSIGNDGRGSADR